MRNFRVLFIGLIMLSIPISIVAATGVFSKDLTLAQVIIALIVAVVEILTLLMIYIQLKRQSDIDMSTFLRDFELSFQENKQLFQKLHQENLGKRVLTEEDNESIIQYLTYFESIYRFLDKSILSITMIDDIFSYRFFLAVHNGFIQQNNLYPYAVYYKNIFLLYEKWIKYKLKKKHDIPGIHNMLKQINPAEPTPYPIAKGSKKYFMRLVEKSEVNDVVALQDKVWEEMENPELFQKTTYQEFRDCLDKGKIIGLYDQSFIVGFLSIRYRSAALQDFESLAIDKAHRGMGLQFELMKRGVDLLTKENVRELNMTVSPHNYFSLNNALKFGFYIKSLKKLYGNKDRFVLKKELVQSKLRPARSKTEVIHSDLTAQEELLGQGFLGIATRNYPEHLIEYVQYKVD